MQTLVQNCLDQRKDIFLYFIEYEKAFDNVQHDLLIKYIQELEMYANNIRIMTNLYRNQTASVHRINGIFINNIRYTNDTQH